MKCKSMILATLIAVPFATGPAWADRVYVSSGSVRIGQVDRYRGQYGYRGHYGGHGHYWAPLGVALGAAVLYSALQPRAVYYQPRVVYAPPVYYSSSTTYVAPYPIAGDPVVVQTYVAPQVATSAPVSPAVLQGVQNAQPGPGASGEQWWYVCKNPAGYYPNVTECPSGCSKLPLTPSGKINP